MKALLFSRLTPLLILKAIPPEALAAEGDRHCHPYHGDGGGGGGGGGIGVGSVGDGGGDGDGGGGGGGGGGDGVGVGGDGIHAGGSGDHDTHEDDGAPDDSSGRGGGDDDDSDDDDSDDDHGYSEEGTRRCLEDLSSLLLERSSRVYEYDQVTYVSSSNVRQVIIHPRSVFLTK